ILDGFHYGASDFVYMSAIFEAAIYAYLFDIGESLPQSVSRIPELNLPHSGSVDQHPAFMKHNQLSSSRRVATFRVFIAHFKSPLHIFADQLVDHSRFADSRRAYESERHSFLYEAA